MQRLPKTVYFKDGFIKFVRESGKIKYQVWKWITQEKLVLLDQGDHNPEMSKEEWVYFAEVDLPKVLKQ